MSHHISISLGTNIQRTHFARRGLADLQKHFTEIALSRMFESEAVGFNGSPFYNSVIAARTDKSVEDVVATLKAIERENGRTHSEKKYCARTLDLDLLTYDNVVTTHPVRLPRVEILQNAFVLQPLAELLPDHVHPEAGKTYRQLWQEYDQTSQRLWPIDFTWSDSEG